eukprot:2783559-Prymnesium_polylepis.3
MAELDVKCLEWRPARQTSGADVCVYADTLNRADANELLASPSDDERLQICLKKARCFGENIFDGQYRLVSHGDGQYFHWHVGRC